MAFRFWFDKKRYEDPDNDCPYWQAPCRKHKCRFYQMIRGQNPNTGQPVEKFDCAIAWLPLLLTENALRQYETAAGTDKVATEVEKVSTAVKNMTSVVEKQHDGLSSMLVEHVRLTQDTMVATVDMAKEVARSGETKLLTVERSNDDGAG